MWTWLTQDILTAVSLALTLVAAVAAVWSAVVSQRQYRASMGAARPTPVASGMLYLPDGDAEGLLAVTIRNTSTDADLMLTGIFVERGLVIIEDDGETDRYDTKHHVGRHGNFEHGGQNDVLIPLRVRETASPAALRAEMLWSDQTVKKFSVPINVMDVLKM